MPRRAVLVFADEMHVDRARRSFPHAALPLLGNIAFASDILPEVDIHNFTSARNTAAARPHVHRQVGRRFATRFENAVETLAGLGYDEVVAIGRDCPGLRAVDIELAFIQLATRKLVLGPDHRGGCYLIAFRSADRALLRDIAWKQNTDCAQLRHRCGEEGVSLLAVKHDLDSWADLRLFARSGEVLAFLARFLLGVIYAAQTAPNRFVDLALQRVRVRGQMPPPAFAG